MYSLFSSNSFSNLISYRSVIGFYTAVELHFAEADAHSLLHL